MSEKDSVRRAIEGLFATTKGRRESAAAGEYKMLLRTYLPNRQADISAALDAVAASSDQLAEAQAELESLTPLVDEARAARQWMEEAARRQALSETLDDMLEAHDELQAYVRFRQDQTEFIKDGQRLIRRAAGETRKALQQIRGVLERIAGLRYDDQRKEAWQELPAIYDALRPVHQELIGFHSELYSRFTGAGLRRWADLYWRTLIAGFPDLRGVEADLSAANPDRQASILKQYKHLISWGLFMPPA
jgi:hypothetical protein